MNIQREQQKDREKEKEMTRYILSLRYGVKPIIATGFLIKQQQQRLC